MNWLRARGLFCAVQSSLIGQVSGAALGISSQVNPQHQGVAEKPTNSPTPRPLRGPAGDARPGREKRGMLDLLLSWFGNFNVLIVLAGGYDSQLGVAAAAPTSERPTTTRQSMR